VEEAMKPLRRKNRADTVSIEAARKRFLEAYALLVPEILAELRETVLPHYASYAQQNAESAIRDLWSVVRHTEPALAGALSAWAHRSLLTFGGEPAWWAMDTALETLRAWRDSIHYPRVCLEWIHPFEAHEQFPAGDLEFFNAMGKSEAEVLAPALATQFAIPRWDRANGETEEDFRTRFNDECKRVRDEHIRESKEWTERRGIEQPLYVDGLAMWQAGRELSHIHRAFKDRGLNVGGDPGDSDYNSAVSKGLDRIAKLIQLDRRPGR
jgi:hypothetical protein